jgi:SAM-dependent MidA family methyltransferase
MHRFAPVLANPGEHDLTAHVDFEAVRRVARDAGALVTSVMGQGAWLSAVGIRARADALSRSNPERSKDIQAALERLVSTDAMGALFKVIGIHAPDWPPPAGFA